MTEVIRYKFGTNIVMHTATAYRVLPGRPPQSSVRQ